MIRWIQGILEKQWHRRKYGIIQCHYPECDKESEIGFYCWKHSWYSHMVDPKENKILQRHLKKEAK